MQIPLPVDTLLHGPVDHFHTDWYDCTHTHTAGQTDLHIDWTLRQNIYGETQNSLVAFPDGSYLELMTPTDPGTEPDRWAGLVATGAAPRTGVHPDRRPRPPRPYHRRGGTGRRPPPATPLAADVSTVPGQPVSFVEPDAGSMLARWLDETEQQPLAFLLSTGDFDAAAERYALTGVGEWADRRVAWFDADRFRAGLGVLEAERSRHTP